MQISWSSDTTDEILGLVHGHDDLRQIHRNAAEHLRISGLG